MEKKLELTTALAKGINIISSCQSMSNPNYSTNTMTDMPHWPFITKTCYIDVHINLPLSLGFYAKAASSICR